MTATYDVVAIGNAIVDVLGHTDDAFLSTHGVPKGGMILIDTEKAASITEALSASAQVAGGSAGNSVACLAELGGKGAFIGKTGDDPLGEVYRTSMTDIGVRFHGEPLPADAEHGTGRCLIAVTDDAERSMATYLGAAGIITDADVDPSLITDAQVVYFEGYLFDSPGPRSAFVNASSIAHRAHRKTALTLSDVGVVERNRDELLRVIRDHVDILFANEAEAMALFQVDYDPYALSEAMRKICEVGIVTRSEKGSLVFGPGVPWEEVPAFTPSQLVDTTGAGDAYAGGFLYGYTRDMPLTTCAKLGSLCATEVISHMGPRPEASLRELAEKEGLL